MYLVRNIQRSEQISSSFNFIRDVIFTRRPKFDDDHEKKSAAVYRVAVVATRWVVVYSSFSLDMFRFSTKQLTQASPSACSLRHLYISNFELFISETENT